MVGDVDLGIDNLTNVDEIGAGSFSTVYSAMDTEFNRPVAVKVLHKLDEAAWRRFDRERKLMGQLTYHPNVTTAFSSGMTSTGKPYLVMEYVGGGSLHDLVADGNGLRWEQAVEYTVSIAEALGHGHRSGVLHRDVKPANILLTAEGTAKLADYGIAVVAGAAASQHGFTLAHSPPETFSGNPDGRDERADLYSLASTMFTLIAGHVPFEGSERGNLQAGMARILNDPVPALNVPTPINAFLARAMAKDPDERPANAAQFVAELRSAAERAAVQSNLKSDPTLFTDNPTVWAEPSASAGRDKVGWLVAAVAMVAVVGAGWFAFFRPAAEGPPDDVAGPGTSAEVAEVTSTTVDDGAATTVTIPVDVRVRSLFAGPNAGLQNFVKGFSLPEEASSDANVFDSVDCEVRLDVFRGTYGADLIQLRDQIAALPDTVPTDYVDPTGQQRGYRTRFDGFLTQVTTGYQSCRDNQEIAYIGTHVLSGWAAINSFLCMAGIAGEIEVVGGETQPCPADSEEALCTRLLANQSDSFFFYSPDKKSDPKATCAAAVANDLAAMQAELPA